MCFGDVRVVEIGRVGGLLHGRVVEAYANEVLFQEGVVVLEDAVAEILETRVLGRTGEEDLAGGQARGARESEACYVSDGGNSNIVVDVDARVRLEQLHSEEVGRCGVVSAVSFEERPLQQSDFGS